MIDPLFYTYIINIDKLKLTELLMSDENPLNSQDSFRDMTLSPQPNRDPNFCFSPYHIAQFLQASKSEALSPDILAEFTNSFKRIVENQNEESSQNQQTLDIMGNRIEEFKVSFDIQQEPPQIIIEEDKENDIPYLTTPLKIKKRQLRSPLQDITPSMTQKKRKTGGKLSVSEKIGLLTPRTMEKSRLASSRMHKAPRF